MPTLVKENKMNRPMLKILFVTGVMTLSSGCATLSGYDASSDFACKASPGVSCDSITGIHENARANNLPSQQVEGQAKVSGTVEWNTKLITGTATNSGTPLYEKPLTLRVWIAPWEDKDQVLHDQSYSYLLVQKAKWNVEHFENSGYKSGHFSINDK